MGLRETLNKNPLYALGAVAVFVVAAGYFILLQVRPTPKVTQAYFTTDDGKTWFADDIDKAPPFMHDGKEALLAHVFECSDGKPFVAFVEKFTPEYKQLYEKVAEARKNQPRPSGIPESGAAPGNGGGLADALMMQAATGRLIKKKGGTEWFPQADARGSQVIDVRCPNGGEPRAVTTGGYMDD